MKSSAFDDLGLPVTLVRGSIELIELNIPWKSMSSSNALIRVKNLEAVLGPNESTQGD